MTKQIIWEAQNVLASGEGLFFSICEVVEESYIRSYL